MTDLEDFTAFFKSKGVPFDVDDDPVENCICVIALAVHDAFFRFNKKGEFIGTYNFEMGISSERLPTPESP